MNICLLEIYSSLELSTLSTCRSKAPQHLLPTQLFLSQLLRNHLKWWVLYCIHYLSQLFVIRQCISCWLSIQCFVNCLICIDTYFSICVTSHNHIGCCNVIYSEDAHVNVHNHASLITDDSFVISIQRHHHHHPPRMLRLILQQKR
jgi:hypothetical protein